MTRSPTPRRYFSGRWTHLGTDRGRITLRYPGRPERHFVYAEGECVGVCRRLDLGDTEGTFVAESMLFPPYDVVKAIGEDNIFRSVRPHVILVRGQPPTIMRLDLLLEPDVHEGVVTVSALPPPPKLPQLDAADTYRLAEFELEIAERASESDRARWEELGIA